MFKKYRIGKARKMSFKGLAVEVAETRTRMRILGVWRRAEIVDDLE